MSTEIVEAQVVEPGMEIATVEAAPPAALFAGEPAEVVAHASSVASALKDVLVAQHMTTNIKGKTYVNVEGWQMLGAMLGVTPVVVWTRELDPGDWEARVEARMPDGRVVGAAEAECRTAEGGNWGPKSSSNARRAMAQTRATSRAMRGPLGFVVTLAGYQATAAEEMPLEEPSPVIDRARADAIAELIGQVIAVDPEAVGRIWAESQCPASTVNRDAVSRLTIAQADRLQPLLEREASK